MVNYLVQEYLDISSKKYSKKTAAVCKDLSVTFGELVIASNQLANCLISYGLRRQDRVVFCLERSINSIFAIAGILKADSIYVPIDAKSPLKRLGKIITDCQPSFIICDSLTIKNILQVVSNIKITPKIIVMGANNDQLDIRTKGLIDQDLIERCDKSNLKYRNIDTDIAYILYTSGSTGDPKGVMISHLNIRNYIEWAIDCIGITEKDNILSTAPFHFDMSTFDIYCAMKAGAKLCITPESYLLFPSKLVKLIEAEKITVWKAISSLLMYLVKTKSIDRGRVENLKKIIFAGEILPTKYIVEWMKIYPDKIFYNGYGPTEATGISTYYKLERIPENIREPIPIGKPCLNTEVLLLKKDNSLAQQGEIGELCIKGSGLSKGYWNDSQKTAESFVTNPVTKIAGDLIYRTGDLAKLNSNGDFEFIGRKDHQIKHLGYRIELFEIENAILSINCVNDTAAILTTSLEYDLPELIAFIELKDGISKADVKVKLKKKLPHYMLPQRLIQMDNILRTDRGKIDRQALKKYYLKFLSNEHC